MLGLDEIIVEFEVINLKVSKEARQKVESRLLQWLDSVHKSDIPDLAKRISEFKPRLQQFAATFEVSTSGTKPTVAVPLNLQPVYLALKNGSMWCDSLPNFELEIFTIVDQTA